MLPCGQLIAQLIDDLDASDNAKIAAIYRRLNLAYFDIAGRISWADMRRTVTLTVTGTAAGVMLPANLAGIDALFDSTLGEFLPRSAQDIINLPDVAAWNTPTIPPWYPRTASRGNADDYVYRYAIGASTSDALAIGTGATVQKGSSTVSGISADYTGEFVVFANRMGFYKFTDATHITPVFMEETVQSGAYTVRPQGTRSLVAYSPDGSLYKGDATLNYWIRPQPITDAAQMILLPTLDVLARAIEADHIALRNIDEKRASFYQRAAADALMTAMSMNPSYISPNAPANAGGTSGMGAMAASPT